MRYQLLAPARREYLDVVRWYRDEVQDSELGEFVAGPAFSQRVVMMQ